MLVISRYLKELVIRSYFVLYSIVFVFISIFIYREEFLVLFAKPFWGAVKDGHFIFTGMGEVFYTYLTIAGVGCVCTFCILFVCNLILFLLPGLYAYERKIVLKCFYLSSLCMLLGLFFVHNVLVNLVCGYLVGYSEVSGIEGIVLRFEPRLGEFVFFIIWLDILFSSVVFALIFSVGYLWLIRSERGLDAGRIGSLRQWVYIGLIILVITLLPADIFLHMIVFCILIGFFELIMVCLMLVRRYEFAWWNR